MANKCNLIRKKLKKTLGKSKLKNDFFNHKNGVGYKIPESKTFWTIFYKVYKNTSVENTRFICIHKHFEDRKSFYIVLDSQQINDVLLQIFNPRTTLVVEPATVYSVLKVPLSTATSAIVNTLNVFAILF